MNREDFPALRDKELVYLDSACMSLRPDRVIEKVRGYYEKYPACSGRSHHSMSERASEELEKSRKTIGSFIGAEKDQIVFTSGTTESINIVARGFGKREKVFVSDREHNSNLVPWQRADDRLETVSTREGFNVSRLESDLEEGDLVSLVHVSNLDGFEIPLEKVAETVRDKGAYLLVDAAQSIPHRPFSVEEISADFVAFSGHKMLGPSGTGALYVSDRVKEDLEPLKVGGGAVMNSTYERSEFKEFPHCMEAGLPNLAGFIGFGEAVRYLDEIGMQRINEHEEKLTEQLVEGLEDIEGVEVYCEGTGTVSFSIEGVDPHQVAMMLDQQDIAVRSGMHCVHSYHNDRGIDPSVRASLYLYNTEKDVGKLIEEIDKIAYLS